MGSHDPHGCGMPVQQPAPAPRRLRPSAMALVWALVGLLAVVLVAANVVLVTRGDARSAKAHTVATPAASAPRQPAGAATPSVPAIQRALGSYTFPSAVGSHVFVSRAVVGGNEVAYYAGSKGPVTLRKQPEALADLAPADATWQGRYACWRDPSRIPRCGVAFTDGTLVLVGPEKETDAGVLALLQEAVRGL